MKSDEIREKSSNYTALKEYQQQAKEQISKLKQTLNETNVRLLKQQTERQEKENNIINLETSLY